MRISGGVGSLFKFLFMNVEVRKGYEFQENKENLGLSLFHAKVEELKKSKDCTSFILVEKVEELGEEEADFLKKIEELLREFKSYSQKSKEDFSKITDRAVVDIMKLCDEIKKYYFGDNNDKVNKTENKNYYYQALINLVTPLQSYLELGEEEDIQDFNDYVENIFEILEKPEKELEEFYEVVNNLKKFSSFGLIGDVKDLSYKEKIIFDEFIEKLQEISKRTTDGEVTDDEISKWKECLEGFSKKILSEEQGLPKDYNNKTCFNAAISNKLTAIMIGLAEFKKLDMGKRKGEVKIVERLLKTIRGEV